MKVSVLFLFLALAAPAVGAHSAPSTTQAAPSHARHGLTPEERVLYMKDMRGPNWHKLSESQRCERIRQIRHEKRAMPPAALQQLKQKLDAEWKALPVAERQRIEQRIAKHQARREQGNRGQHSRRCSDAEGQAL